MDGALQYAFDGPEQINALVRQMIDPVSGTEAANQLVNALVPSIRNRALSDAQNRLLRSDLRRRFLETPRGTLVQTLRMIAPPNQWPQNTLIVPVLAVHAPNPLWDEAYVKTLRSIAPRVEVESWEDVGHYVMIDDPERFNERLIRFIRSVVPADSTDEPDAGAGATDLPGTGEPADDRD